MNILNKTVYAYIVLEMDLIILVRGEGLSDRKLSAVVTGHASVFASDFRLKGGAAGRGQLYHVCWGQMYHC